MRHFTRSFFFIEFIRTGVNFTGGKKLEADIYY